MTSDRKLPQGRAYRLLKMASTGARTGLGLVGGGDGTSTAVRAAEALGTLRGLAAKAGQMASYVDGLVPEAQSAAFETALGRLRNATPSSSFPAVRQLIERELEAPLSELFSGFEERPFASASIGQVHRATLPDGRRVAVKVQHPGIERAIESDLDNASIVEGMVGSLGARKVGSKEVMDAVRARFLEELDYRLEAERQVAFARAHRDDPKVAIPDIVPTHSTKRVLTSDLVDGQSLDEVRNLPEAERAEYSRTLWRFVFRGVLVHGLFNADPHPGNYLFQEDGRICFLDFGCVQVVPEDHRTTAVKIHRAAAAGDESTFRREVANLMSLRGGEYERLVGDYTRKCFEPLFASPFRFDRQYVTQVVHGIKDLKRHVMRRRDDVVPMPPEMVFMNRLQFGFYSVLARLEAEVDYAAVEREFLGTLESQA